MEKAASVGKRALRYSIGSFLSRVSGMAREMVTAAFFGANASIASFMVAYRFSHVLRRLLGEGGLVHGFIPHFTHERTASEEGARAFFRDLVGTLLFLTLGAIIAGEGILLCFAKRAPEIVQLSMIMLPGLLLIVVWALFGALHQCEGRYFLPGVSPALCNGVWIATVVFASRWPVEQGVYILAIGTVLAFGCQLASISALPLRWLRRAGRPKLFSPPVRALIRSLSYTVIGVGATQINNFFDMLFARYASLEGPAHLAYAIRLEQFPLALIPIALSTALLPTLSRETETRARVASGLQKVYFLILPCTLAIVSMGDVIVNAVYGRGAFDLRAVGCTTRALWAYGAGLIPMSFAIVLSQSYFARKEFKTPMVGAVQTVALNLSLNAIFVYLLGWGAESVAWATSIASLYNMLFLLRGHYVETAGMWRMTGLGLVAAAAVWFFRSSFAQVGTTRILSGQLFQLFSLGALFLLLYGLPLFFLHRKREI